MDLDEARWWLEILEQNLVSVDYKVATDDEVHFKLAAIQRLKERNEELTTMLVKIDGLRDGLGEIVGKLL